MAITADRLLTGIKRRILVPTSQATFTETDLLAFADDIISSRIVPMIESTNQEFFVTTVETPLVAGQSEYSIPYRAVGRALREIKIKDDNNNIRNISLIAIEDAFVYDASTLTIGFFFKGDKIRLLPDVPTSISVSQSLQIWYRLPPSRLVQSSEACQVVGVNGDTVTVANVPTTIITGSVIDFIQGKSGNSLYSIDQTITNISGTDITFGTDVVPDDLTVGDYISLAQTSPVINFVPNECYSLIESLTARRVLVSAGDFDGAKMLDDDISTEEKNVKMLLEPRIDGEPTIIINRWGLVRGNKFAQRRWLYGQ